jgi:PAS domain S-box-containing protein
MPDRILNVDDNAASRYVRSKILRGAGFEITEAATGSEALRIAQSEIPPLVVLDMHLPDVPGLEVCRRIKSDQATSSIQVLQVSATSIGEKDLARGLEGGADAYLAEPVSPEVLVATARALLRNWYMQRELRQALLEKSRAEAALKESQERLRATLEAFQHNQARLNLVLDSIYLGLWYCDLPSRKLEWNATCKSHIGLPPDSEVTFETFFEHLHPEDRESVRKAIEHSLSHRATFDQTYRTVADDGRTRWVRGIGRIFSDDSGTPVRFDGITLDITSQKEAENALRSSERALRASNDDLQRFASVVSHDLQEPLRVAFTYSQLLANRYKEKLDADADEFLGFLQGSVHRMRMLIRDLLEFSRVATVEERPLAPTSMEGVLAETLLNLHTAIVESGARVTHDPLPTVLAGHQRLTQVMQNLIANAIKYRTAEPLQIHVSAREEAGDWVFSVRDNGSGFDMAYADRIFGMFQRLHGSGLPGTGLGLAICRRIIERLGGRIWAESAPGAGATFYFTIPKAET